MITASRCWPKLNKEFTKIAQPAVPVPAVPFRSGDMVKHKKWGGGMVQTIEGDTVTVHFPDVGYKTLALNMVLQSGLLMPAAS